MNSCRAGPAWPSLPHLVRRRQFTLHRDHPLVHPDLGLLPEGHLCARGLEEGGDVSPLAPDHQPAGREWDEHALREGERVGTGTATRFFFFFSAEA